MSSVAWLDTSPEEQRKVREMLSLFTQKDSLDELGIGSIRDALSNTLFPGTSTLHTRARYFLIVPWCYLKAASRASTPQQVHDIAQGYERDVARTLKRTHPEEVGLIGARAGERVKTLPSSMFWAGLIRWGVLQRNVDPLRLISKALPVEDTDELVQRRTTDWHPSLPPAPHGFPWELENGLTLTHEEATWLRDRIMASTEGSLLARLAEDLDPLDENSEAPWTDSKVHRLAGDSRELEHARRFSTLIFGASRLYNLLIAEAYVAAGYNRALTSTDIYEQQYDEWLASIADEPDLIDGWDLQEFWRTVRLMNPRVTNRTQAFVEHWATLVRHGHAVSALDAGSRARRLIANREQSLKRSQSRLTNRKLLGMWGGGSMSLALNFRWPQVRRVLTDIQQGVVAGEVTHAGT